MSEVKYIKCDGINCGRVTPRFEDMYTWVGATHEQTEGWVVIEVRNRTLHLCQDCAKKALEAVGLE